MAKKAAAKDPQFAQKLEENAKKTYGRAYRFLTKEQKQVINAETKFEPKVEEPKNADVPVSGSESGQPVPQAESPKEAPKAKEPAVLKHAEPFVDHIVQYRCEVGHITNGKVTAPALGCRVNGCEKAITKTGHYENDIFVPV